MLPLSISLGESYRPVHRHFNRDDWPCHTDDRYGESVGHYEGDTLVVVTAGFSTKTFVDNYRTPHTDKLHVIERFQTIEVAKILDVKVHTEDPDGFTTQWDVSQRYVRCELQPIQERICTENNANFVNLEIVHP